MWDLVLTVRQQLQWEFSNAYVVKKTTTTTGSQRLHQRLEKEKFLNKSFKDTICFAASSFYYLVEKMQMDLHEPPMSQVNWTS